MTVDIYLSKSSISSKCYRLSKVHIRSTDVCVKCWFDIYYKYYWNRIFAGSALWNVFLSHIDEERKSDSKKPFQFLKYISSRLQSSTLRLFFAIWHFFFYSQKRICLKRKWMCQTHISQFFKVERVISRIFVVVVQNKFKHYPRKTSHDNETSVKGLWYTDSSSEHRQIC